MAVVGSLQRLGALLFLPTGRRLCSSSVGRDVYDLVVVGGGMVGSALACNVGREPSFSHKRVLLLESNPSPPRPITADDAYSNRVSTLSLGSVDLMKRIGAWEAITKLRANAFTQLHVWDACSEARLVFNNQTSHDFGTIAEGVSHDQEEAVPEEDIIGSGYRSSAQDVTSDDIMGYIVENKFIMAALLGVLEDCTNVEVRRGVKTLEVQPSAANCKDDPSSPWVELTLNSGETISTRLLVGSDGPNSRIRHLCDFQHVGWKYDQSALLATLHIHALNDNNSTAWQRFLPTGPIAMLPLSDSLSSLIWSTTPSHAQSLLELPEERFVDAINTAFWDPFPQDDLVTTVNEAVRDALAVLNADSPPPPRQLPPTVSGIIKDSRAAFPLSLGHAPFYVKPRIALIGDAAHTVHVMAGQGLNLGFGDVVQLTQCLLQANSRGADWGSLSTLLEYETARQRHNVPMAATIEGLYHLFSTSWTPAVLLRSLGFQITNAVPPIKVFDHLQSIKTWRRECPGTAWKEALQPPVKLVCLIPTLHYDNMVLTVGSP